MTRESSSRPVGAQGTMVGRYLLGPVVGKGVGSELRLAKDTVTEEEVALKIMQKEWIWKNDMSKLVRREIGIIRELDHPSVVKLIEVFNSETHVFMAMEGVDGTDLREELRLEGRMDEDRARDIFQQVMMALQYLHSIGVAHRDLTLENVLLREGGQQIKLAGFGLAAYLEEWEGGTARNQNKRRSWSSKKHRRRQQRACGTPEYAPPEVFMSSEDQRYDSRGVDAWCAGVCLFAIVTGEMPFAATGVEETAELVQTTEPRLPEQLSPELTNLLRGMLTKDPSKRLTVNEALNHPWTTGITRLLSPQPDINPTEQAALAETARVAIREARQAALEAERAAAAAAAAETNAAKALAKVNQAAAAGTPRSTPSSGGGGGGGSGTTPSWSRGSESRKGLDNSPALVDPAEEAGPPGGGGGDAGSGTLKPVSKRGIGSNLAGFLGRWSSMENGGGDGGGGGKQAAPANRRHGRRRRIKRSTSVDSRQGDALAAGVRQDSEWSSTGARERTWSDEGSALGVRPTGEQFQGRSSPVRPAAVPGTSAGNDGGLFVTTGGAGPASAKNAATAESRREPGGVSLPVDPARERGSAGNASREAGAVASRVGGGARVGRGAGRRAGGGSARSEQPLLRSASLADGPESGGAKGRGVSKRPAITRSLSSVFAATSRAPLSPKQPAPPPPIASSMSFDLVVAPAVTGTPKVTVSAADRAVPEAAAMTPSPREAAAAEADGEPLAFEPAGADVKSPEAGKGRGGHHTPVPSLPSVSTMSMSPQREGSAERDGPPPAWMDSPGSPLREKEEEEDEEEGEEQAAGESAALFTSPMVAPRSGPRLSDEAVGRSEGEPTPAGGQAPGSAPATRSLDALVTAFLARSQKGNGRRTANAGGGRADEPGPAPDAAAAGKKVSLSLRDGGEGRSESRSPRRAPLADVVNRAPEAKEAEEAWPAAKAKDVDVLPEGDVREDADAVTPETPAGTDGAESETEPAEAEGSPLDEQGVLDQGMADDEGDAASTSSEASEAWTEPCASEGVPQYAKGSSPLGAADEECYDAPSAADFAGEPGAEPLFTHEVPAAEPVDVAAVAFDGDTAAAASFDTDMSAKTRPLVVGPQPSADETTREVRTAEPPGAFQEEEAVVAAALADAEAEDLCPPIALAEVAPVVGSQPVPAGTREAGETAGSVASPTTGDSGTDTAAKEAWSAGMSELPSEAVVSVSRYEPPSSVGGEAAATSAPAVSKEDPSTPNPDEPNTASSDTTVVPPADASDAEEGAREVEQAVSTAAQPGSGETTTPAEEPAAPVAVTRDSVNEEQAPSGAPSWGHGKVSDDIPLGARLRYDGPREVGPSAASAGGVRGSGEDPEGDMAEASSDSEGPAPAVAVEAPTPGSEQDGGEEAADEDPSESSSVVAVHEAVPDRTVVFDDDSAAGDAQEAPLMPEAGAGVSGRPASVSMEREAAGDDAGGPSVAVTSANMPPALGENKDDAAGAPEDAQIATSPMAGADKESPVEPSAASLVRSGSSSSLPTYEEALSYGVVLGEEDSEGREGEEDGEAEEMVGDCQDAAADGGGGGDGREFEEGESAPAPPQEGEENTDEEEPQETRPSSSSAAAAAARPAAASKASPGSATSDVPAAKATSAAGEVTPTPTAAPAPAAPSTPRPASMRRGRTARRDGDRGAGANRGRGSNGGGGGGEGGRGENVTREARASRSPVDQTVLWEPINPFAGDPVQIKSAGRSRRRRPSSLAPPRTRTAEAAAAARDPRVPQAATFEEMMAGIKNKLVAEGWESGARDARTGDPAGPPGVVGDDDDAESRFGGDDLEAPKAASAAATKGASTPVTPNIRKLAEAGSIWGPSTAAAAEEEERTPDKAGRRKASGRYRRLPSGQYRSRSVQPPPPRTRRALAREEERAIPKMKIGLKITGNGSIRGPLGKPSAVCDPSVEPPAVTAPPPATEVATGAGGKKVSVDVGKKPRKRGKSIGRKITGMFRRNSEVH